MKGFCGFTSLFFECEQAGRNPWHFVVSCVQSEGRKESCGPLFESGTAAVRRRVSLFRACVLCLFQAIDVPALP